MKKLLLLFVALLSATVIMAQSANPYNEESPNQPNPQNPTKGSWTVEFNYSPIPASGSAGCETDGTYFYVTQWNGSLIWKFNSSGTLIDSFSIAGVSGLRDLAYDGTYFYGGNAGQAIFKMDFTNETLVSTFYSPSQPVRNICYDPAADNGNGAFWVGNWSTDLALISRSGTELQSIPSTTHGLSSTYGTAYDTITPGGPYIWAINATSAANTTITQLDASTGAPTGLTHDLTTDVCQAGELGGGLWIEDIQGTTVLGGLIQNTSIFGYDLATVNPDTFDLAHTSFNLPSLVPQGQNVNIAGVITNNGLQTITSFDLHYKVDNGSVVTDNITGVSIASYGTYNYTHSTAWTPTAGAHTVEVWYDNLNGNADQNPSNDTLIMSTTAYDPSAAVQRIPLHEAFTSSTCGPCVAGNANLSTIFTTNPFQWVCIKYQMSWPGDGDPYYTAEGGDRRVYYGVNSVPNLKVDGGYAFDGNSSSYADADIDAAYTNPAFVEIIAHMDILPANNEVKVNYTINNNIDLPASARVFIGVVEEQTFNNVGSNGETVFDWVMKKMLPDADGSVIGPLNAGDNLTDSISYAFKGSYRLPNSANDPINHATEHSVEDFENLVAVVWVQDYTTARVYQSAYSSVTVGIDKNELSNMNLNVYPNPTEDIINIDFNANETEDYSISVKNALGQTIYSSESEIVSGQNNIKVNLSSEPKGMYFVKIETTNGYITKPVVLK